jgi:glutamate-1-semialdehyde 2,1-aminomutase
MQNAKTITDIYSERHPTSALLYQESIQTFPSGVTHDIRFLTPFPLFIDRAIGSRKWDVDGHEYIDYVMGHGALLLGHAHPEITQAVVDQASRGTHYGGNTRLEVAWGELVRRIVPSAEAVRFTSSGTEATLMALRLARAYTGRDRVLKFDQHFHGWHDYVVGTRGAEADSPQSSGVPAATLGTVVSVPQGDLASVEEKLADGSVAAVILEPTGASWGTLPLNPQFLSALRDVCTGHNTVLIFDEVVTGFRVAPGGAQERYGVTPDVTTLAKILAGGLPGGAVTGKTDIVSMIEFREDGAWNARRRVQHPGTFNANPLSAAAGKTMLEIVSTGAPHLHAGALNEALIKGLNETLQRVGVPGRAFGLSSYFHVALGEDATVNIDGIEWPIDHEAPPRMPASLSMALRRAMLNEGVDLMGGTGGFVSGVHTERDIEETVAAFESAISALAAEGQSFPGSKVRT